MDTMNMDTMNMDIMNFGNILIVSFFILSIVLYCVLSFITPNPRKNFTFLFIELLRQSSLVYVLVHFVCIMYAMELGFLPTNSSYILIPLTTLWVYFMAVSMGYTQTSSCEKPKRSIIYIQALKPVVFVILGFLVATKISISRQGFYDIASAGEPSDLGLWVAKAFWMASFLWPSVTWAYFSIQQHACNDNTQITIKSVPKEVRPLVI